MGNSTHGGLVGPIDSLDYALAALRQRVSSVLHDDVGPSLCAAGLHLDLLAGAGPATSDFQESAASLRAAVESALASIRALLVENDPRLFTRGGLDGALSTLAQYRLIDWEEPPHECPLATAQAELYFRVVRDWAMARASAQPHQRLTVRRAGHEMRITAPREPGSGAGVCSCVPLLAGWQFLAAAAGVTIDCKESDQGLSLLLAPATAPVAATSDPQAYI